MTNYAEMRHTLASREQQYIHFWLSIFSQRKKHLSERQK